MVSVSGRLMGPRCGMTEIQTIALFEFGRGKIGADQMGEIIAGAPGLSQFA